MNSGNYTTDIQEHFVAVFNRYICVWAVIFFYEVVEVLFRKLRCFNRY